MMIAMRMKKIVINLAQTKRMMKKTVRKMTMMRR